MPFNVNLWEVGVSVLEILIRHNLEKESEDTGSELRGTGVLSIFSAIEFLRISIWIELEFHLMNNMHFEIKKLSVNGVLTRGMEMELETVELGLRDVAVEERDGLGLHDVIVLCFILSLKNINLELITSFVENQLFLGVNGIILEAEGLVFESRDNRQRCWQVNWGLMETELKHQWVKLFVLQLLLNFWRNIEVDSWSFSNWILPIFKVIVLEVVDHASILAVWSAEGQETWVLFWLLVLLVIDVDGGKNQLSFFFGRIKKRTGHIRRIVISGLFRHWSQRRSEFVFNVFV